VDEGPVPGLDIASELNAAEMASHPGSGADEVSRELAAQHDRYLRLAAEFDNFRRRTAKEKLEAGARAQATLARELLDTLDDLDRVVAMDSDGADAASFIQGVELVARKLAKSLTAAGLEVIDPTDASFDPNVHEAVATQPAESPDRDDHVAAVFQRGYLFKGQLLRPARVAVSKWQD
jgi:molecular chaperone GrpE